MGSLRAGHWVQVVVYMLLLQLQTVKVQGFDSVSQKLQQLNEQFQQFQALTHARLNMLALNQNKSSFQALQSRLQTLNDHYHHVSQDLEHLKHSATQEIEGLRERNRKLERKNKRLEGRLTSMERKFRQNCHQTQKVTAEPEQDFSNLTLELQSQEERLAALQIQRDELLIGLKGLLESLKNQATRLTRLEGRLSKVLEGNGRLKVRGLWRAGEPVSSNITPQEYYRPCRRGQPSIGGKCGRILEVHTRPRSEGSSKIKTDSHLQNKPHQLHVANQTKHSKAQNAESQPQIQVQKGNPKAHPDPFQPQSQSQVQTQAQTQPYPLQNQHQFSHQTFSHHQRQTDSQVQKPGDPQKSHKQPSWMLPQVPTYHKPEDKQNRTRLKAPQPRALHVFPKPKPDTYEPRASRWDEEKEDISDMVIPNFLQIPVRHKIPTQPIPKRDATICNVDSMLLFPSASAENYVTFSPTLPDLPELSVCLWLRVEATHIGTLLSYATDDNDNQLVLYGHRSLSSSAPSSVFSSSSSSSSSSTSSSPSLDFVVGDPAYRRLQVSALLDARWHHLCVVWSSIDGRFWHYNNHLLASSGSDFRKGWEIPGGGAVVLGQEQDSVGGGFDPAEGFAGQLAGFRLWNRVLSPSEVEGVAAGRGVPRGVVLGMEDIQEVHGEVHHVACDCLEYCV
ncbi:uncharacterized protein ptx4 [Archocentrus centrarchus]|uniref:uncharacterized protein ptx4 n=1 Tax=Archocentrus centrarchus TaxID=63155 RepID=UPI0011E9C21D|nr:pentraxin-4 [Archocentrus centrarchus]